jgi:hypothetical protein
VGRSLFAHDIHVSVSEIELSESTIEITIKTFIDDLQLALGLTPGEELPANYTSAEELIESYLNKKMKLSINGKMEVLKIKRMDSSIDKSVWITLEKMRPSHPIKTLHIDSEFLIEQFSDQANLFNLKNGDQKEYVNLNRKKNNHEFQIR